MYNGFWIRRTVVVVSLCVMTSLVGEVAWSTGVATSLNEARILRVESVLDSGVSAMWDSSLMSSRLPKFGDATASSPRQIFNVYWNPVIAVPAGTLVTFEYLQEFSKHVQFLFTKYEWPVEDEEKTVFSIDIGGVQAAGPVTAWRARVVYRGKLLAEAQSGNWR